MSTSTGGRHTSAFDVRLIIALLLGVYGAVLTIMGAGFTSDDDLAKADNVNINLWAGIAMLVAAVLFVAWAKIRPLVIPAAETTEEPAAGDTTETS
ncbi:hypothetical protein EV193_108294 [Herbihabitans rhizosphaerae]|uniref:Uncharacterized protein n=1 Tax=Herbihabitans rhizosphaerae TaxID=1872711 RepID=A0A4Q7KJX8_9PSEU|nr:hypothetical protein [Herbihabitans rhizosphaerae]RZS34944.1 hypothetical protein EV193_108294 [Herbihabitans rhizosphaerae]